MISPLQAHLNETITSLKFATKVCLEFLPLTSKANYSDRCTTRTLAQPRSKPKPRTKHLFMHGHLFCVSKRLNWAITYDITGVARKTRCWIPLERFMYLLFFGAANRSVQAGLLTSLTGVWSDDWASWEEGEEPQIGLGLLCLLILCGGGFSVFLGAVFWGWKGYSRCEMEVGRIVNIFTI